MNKHTLDAQTDAALRDLDAAPMTALTDAERERAEAIFARIVATPSEGCVPATPRPRRRPWKLLVPAGLTATAAGVAIPTLLLGGSAFGSWTETPVPLTGKAAAEAGATCRANLPMPDQEGRVVIAERRGDWTYVLIAGPTVEGACLMPHDLVGPRDLTDDEEWVLGNYSPDPMDAPPLAPEGITETGSLGSTVPVPDPWPFSTGEGWVNWVEGYLGSDVTGVTVHTSSGLDIEASITGNRFAAWWPSPVQSSDYPDGESWSYTVHLADGSSYDTEG